MNITEHIFQSLLLFCRSFLFFVYMLNFPKIFFLTYLPVRYNLPNFTASLILIPVLERRLTPPVVLTSVIIGSALPQIFIWAVIEYETTRKYFFNFLNQSCRREKKNCVNWMLCSLRKGKAVSFFRMILYKKKEKKLHIKMQIRWFPFYCGLATMHHLCIF